ncbi:YVTN repeat-like/Quino protein amine dehydrogenase [Trichodelitschia bisporula]|uniref:YVTN repeat-like/Quino protein amine dehydrogenase n=1 Tax=Trichodelitschia bisporula TaxID=703511 RepID=A0A6G1HR03_9PEZI|nr:YVTN repeat-like/Quino protein amine dehydrogenase [Trichodelitschia bisporula]
MSSSSSTDEPVGICNHSPCVKRRKQTNLKEDSAVRALAASNREHRKRSRIFAPFRTVGLVSPTEVPFTTVPLGKTTFQITTSVGRSLQTYDLRRGLNLVFVTRPQTPELITATTSWKGCVLAAWGGKKGDACGVWVYKRGQKVDELQMPDGCEPVKQLLTFGSWIVGCCETRIEVWSASSNEHYTTLFPRGNVQLTGGITNMPTYLNKILVGRSDGCVDIWNVNTGKLIYTILPPASDYGAVTALQPSPALSLCAIAYEAGPVIIQDIRTDKQVILLNNAIGRTPPVTSISFRTDGLGAGNDGRKDGVMATATRTNGDVTFWDLNDGGRRMGVLRGAHNPPSTVDGQPAGGVSKIEFLAGQGVILTSGLDNALKSWIFDEAPFSPVPRILHSRSGHAAPVSCLEFLPANSEGADYDGKWLLSASKDRSLWGWSLRRDGQSTELSQGNIRKKAKKMGLLNVSLLSEGRGISAEELKAPPITCMACSLNRDGGMGTMPGSKEIWMPSGRGKTTQNTADSSITGWESVVTGHEGDRFARTWFWGRKKAGRWMLETGDGTIVTSVAVSPCGSFALVGSVAGGIDMFNLQSGIHRQRFPPKLTQTQAKRLKAQQGELSGSPIKSGKHTAAVTGVQVDSLNRTVVSCGADGKVKFWNFATGKLEHELEWSITSVTGVRYHRPSDLMAFTCADSTIRIIDITTRRVVRELHGSTGLIADFIFSPDGRWLLAADSASVMRVWDLPTSHLIEALRFRSPATALAFSPAGDFLATAHPDSQGISLWSNRALFKPPPTRALSPTDIFDADIPTASAEGGETLLESAFNDEAPSDMDVIAPPIDQLSDSLLTLSLVPRPRWQALQHLDVVRARNKPIAPPKPPVNAPFFLPSLGDTKPGGKDWLVQATRDARAQVESRVLRAAMNVRADPLSLALKEFAVRRDSAPVVGYLASLVPAAGELAIRGLDARAPYAEMVAFIEALTARVKARRDFECCY